jgi:nickel superoxide dismutase
MKFIHPLLPGILFATAVFFGASKTAQAHCQVPCGIYDDNARMESMLEDAATVEKAVTALASLAGKADAQSLNQSVRWVTNKEIHAQRIIATISDYFLTQRVKPGQDDYATRLARHHAVILSAMKAKQTADADSAQVLRESIQALRPYYPTPAHEH